MSGEVAAIAVRGRWLKHAYAGSPALPEREPPPDNRWQRGEIVDAVYLADSEDTTWAEWYRRLAERAIPPLAQNAPRAVELGGGAEEAQHATSRRPAETPAIPSPKPGYHSSSASDRSAHLRP